MARPLPYNHLGQLQEQGGQNVAQVPCSVWQSSRRVSGAGEYYDATGEAPARFHDQLTVTNRHIVIDGLVYTIVEVGRPSMLPHVTLRLRRRSG